MVDVLGKAWNQFHRKVRFLIEFLKECLGSIDQHPEDITEGFPRGIEELFLGILTTYSEITRTNLMRFPRGIQHKNP